MAELLECLICGYQTVRCGMTNHLSSKHPKEYLNYLQRFRAYTLNHGASAEPNITRSLGQVKHWSKDRAQKPKVKAPVYNPIIPEGDTFFAEYCREFQGANPE
jgi:hypothetical protein